MKTLKKWISLFLTVSMLVSMLAGLQGNVSAAEDMRPEVTSEEIEISEDSSEFNDTVENCHTLTEEWFGSANQAENNTSVSPTRPATKSAPSNTSIDDIIDAYFTERETELITSSQEQIPQPKKKSAAAPLVSSESVNEEAIERAEGMKEFQSRTEIQITDAEITATLDKDHVIQNEDGTITVYVYEWTFFDYDDVNDDIVTTDVSGFGVYHKITLQKNNNSYIVILDEYDESDLSGMCTITESTIQEIEEIHSQLEESEEINPVDSTTIDNISPPKRKSTTNFYANYSPDKAAAYADEYVNKEADGKKIYAEFYNNYNYYNFNPDGGDCANYASQCIAAGGMPQDISANGWYYNISNGEHSVSWTFTPTLRRYFGDTAKRGVDVEASNDTVYKGSPVFYDSNNHTEICVGYDSANIPIINSHNMDRYHVRWDHWENVDIYTVQLTAKNPRDSIQFTKPSGSAIPYGTTTISWTPVKNATKYQVIILLMDREPDMSNTSESDDANTIILCNSSSITQPQYQIQQSDLFSLKSTQSERWLKIYVAAYNSNGSIIRTGSSYLEVINSELKINVDEIGAIVYQGRHDITGSITSNNNIKRVIGRFLQNGKELKSVEIKPNCKSVSLKESDINNKLIFAELGVGSYTLQITAEDSTGKSVTRNVNFSIETSLLKKIQFEKEDRTTVQYGGVYIRWNAVENAKKYQVRAKVLYGEPDPTNNDENGDLIYNHTETDRHIWLQQADLTGALKQNQWVKIYVAAYTGSGTWICGGQIYLKVANIDDRSSTTLPSDSDNENVVYHYMTSNLGLNTAAACGVLGNMHKQTGGSFSPTLYNESTANNSHDSSTPRKKGDTTALGRYAQLLAWCATNSLDSATWVGLLYFIKYLLETNLNPVYEELKSVENSAQGAYEAAIIWAKNFEECDESTYEERGNLARDTYWAKYSTQTQEERLLPPEIVINQVNVGSFCKNVEKKYKDNLLLHASDSLSLSWTAVDGAAKYRYTLKALDDPGTRDPDNPDEPGTAIYDRAETTNPSLPAFTTEGELYKLGVCAVSESGREGSWALAYIMVYNAPILLLNGVAVGQNDKLDDNKITAKAGDKIKLSWEDVPEATSYDYHIIELAGTDPDPYSGNEEAKKDFGIVKNVPAGTVASIIPEEEGIYKFSVRANGTETDNWSVTYLSVGENPNGAGAVDTNGQTLQSIIDASTGSKAAPTLIRLTEDITECVTVNSGQYIILDLNGHTLNGGNQGSVITNYGTLTLRDSSEDALGKITGGNGGNYGGGVYNYIEASFTMESGTITGCTAQRGGAVYNAREANFTMNGGVISECNYCGIYNDGGHVTMTNGIIKKFYNYSSAGYGGIYNASGTIAIEGGTITDCSYGGIYNYSSGTVTMVDGTIARCGSSSISAGGGIYNFNGTITINGGAIKDCISVHYGGGVYNDSGTLTMTGGTISYCTSSIGGGIYNGARTLTMTGGTISYCTVNNNGGGIYNAGNVTITGGAIKSCTSSTGGGIYNNTGTVTMTEGTISACEANSYGGGIYNVSGSITINGGTITGCGAKTEGNGLYSADGTVTITDGLIRGEILKDYGRIFVSGGQFSQEVNRYYLAVGYVCVPNAQGNADYKVQKKNVEYVAQIGSTKYPTLQKAINVASSAAEIKLIEDTKECVVVASGKNVTIDLNGYIIDAVGAGSVITNHGTLTLKDSGTEEPGRLTGGSAGSGGGVNNDGTFTMEGGLIIDCGSSVSGNGVYNTGIFVMTGGTISRCRATSGSGIYNYSYAELTLDGGVIEDCSATHGGGGIYNHYASIISFTGGTIANCTTSRNGGGGGIYNLGELTLDGGNITNCNASNSNGGGVYNTDIFTMKRGTISSCHASNGGGIYNNDVSLFTLEGGTITECSASNGGGVFVTGTGEFDMVGGTISTCSANGYGGGVYNDRKLFLMDGGTIIDCHAQNDGGGVYNTQGNYNMTAGQIIECRAISAGGGIYNSSGTFTMEDGTISNCQASNGSGVYNNRGNYNMTAGQIKGCRASSNGGGIYNSCGTFTMEDGTIFSCQANYGGGVYSCSNSNSSSIAKTIIKNGAITDCRALAYGGGIYNGGTYESTLTMSGGIISACRADAGAGIYNTQAFTMQGGTISGGRSTGGGGSGVYQKGNTFTMSNGNISGEIRLDGGSIAISGGRFSQDVSDWVTEGLQCTASGDSDYPYVVQSAHTHTASDPVQENVVAATCTKGGSYDEVVYCSDCGEELSRTKKTVEKLGHNYVDGTCTRCGDSASHEHDYTAVVTAPTCTAKGYTTYTCSTCGDTYQADYTSPLGHYLVTDAAIPATCIESGLTEGSHCTRSGCDYRVKQKEIPALGHNYVDGKCTRCNEIDPNYHSPDTPPEDDAPQFVIGKVSGIIGSTVSVPVSIKNNPGIISAYLNLSYDTEKLELLEVEDKALLVDFMIADDLNVSPFRFSWDGAQLKDNITSDGELAVFTFRIKEDCEPGKLPLSLQFNSLDVLNHESQPVSFGVNAGEIEVISYMPGDVDGNLLINAKDVLFLRRYYINQRMAEGQEINLLAGDVDGVPGISARDILYVRRTVLGNPNVILLPAVQEPKTVPRKSAPSRTKAAPDENAPTFIMGSGIGNPGDEITLDLSIQNNPGIISAYLELNYDSEKLELLDIESTNLLKDYMGADDFSAVPYRFSWDGAALKADITENGIIAKLTFKVLQNLDGNEALVSVSYVPGNILNYAADDIDFQTQSGTVGASSHTHSYQSVLTAPTCTEQGYTTYICDVPDCSDTYIADYVPALGHDIVKEAAVAPTCTESGWTEGGYCTRCDYRIAQTEIPATGHNYVDGRCTVCGKLASSGQLTVGSVSGNAGMEVTVPIRISENPGIITVFLDVSYDPTYLQLVKAENTGLLPLSTFEKSNDLSTIPFAMNWEDSKLRQNITMNGVIALLTFRIKQDCPLETFPITVNLRSGNVLDTDLNDVAFDVTNGSIKVVDYMPGDLDDNGEVNARDLMLLRRYLALWQGIEFNALAADVDGIAGITAEDAVVLQRYLAHWVGVSLQRAKAIPSVKSAPKLANADESALISISSAHGAVGEEVSLDVKLENNPGLIALFLNLDYDTNLLSLVKAEKTDLLNVNCFMQTDDISAVPYALNWEGSTLTENLTQTGVIARLTFKILEDCGEQGAEISVSCTPGNILNYDMKRLNVQTKSGIITGTSANNPICRGDETCASHSFTDIPAPSNWAHEGIDYCIANNLMNGTSDTKFNPNGNLTRAQLVTILYRMADSPSVKFESKFSDVKESAYYYDAVIWASEIGIITGYPEGIFKPDAMITREQIATILYRYAGNPEVSDDLDAFPDSKDVSNFAKDALVWATSEKLINGVNSNSIIKLNPKANATRAQTASIIMRYHKAK